MNIHKIIREEVSDFDWANKVLNESNEFSWAEETPLPTIYIGKEFTESPKFYTNADDTIFHITKIENKDEEERDVVWVMGDGLDSPVDVSLKSMVDGFEKGEYLPVNLNESEFEWAEDTPEKKTVDTLEVGDQVYYTGEYDECHDWPYYISKIWSGGWYDIKAVNPWDSAEEMHNAIQQQGGKLPYNEVSSIRGSEIDIR